MDKIKAVGNHFQDKIKLYEGRITELVKEKNVLHSSLNQSKENISSLKREMQNFQSESEGSLNQMMGAFQGRHLLFLN